MIYNIVFFYRQPIINYIFNFASLGHLADSVKPGGKLKNTVAEIGIYVINGKKKRGATRQVLPLHVSVSPSPHPSNLVMF